MLAALIFLVVTLIVLLIAWWYLEYFKYNKYLKKYRGPRPLPIVGNAHLVRSITDVIPVITKELAKQYGGVVKLMIGPYTRLAIIEPKAAEFLLRSATIIKKSAEYSFFHEWLGMGLLTSWGEKWKRQRKLITPTFHFKILEQFIGMFDAESNILVEKLCKEDGGAAFDIYPYINLCALDIICEAAMGTSVNAQKNSTSAYVMSVKEICKIITVRVFSPLKIPNFLFKFTLDCHRQKRALSTLHGYTNYVIGKRRQQLVNNKNLTINDDGTGLKKRLAFLDLLLECNFEGESLSNESIREEVDTFMFEGHDTTTSGISFTLYSLSKNPEIQEKVVEELRNIFADDKTRSPTYHDLQEMKYLEMVIKEALRLYPPVPVYSRVLEENVEFNGDILPKGLGLVIAAFWLHRQPEVFPDPEKFDPERFSPENSAGRSPYAYVPFSAGPRNCIGQRFAMLELKSVVSKILRHFEILPVPEHKPVLIIEVILKSANGLPVRLKKRDL